MCFAWHLSDRHQTKADEEDAMGKTERVCVRLHLTEMKPLEGQRSSHPETSLRACRLCPLQRSDKHTVVCSLRVDDWLNKCTGSMWCRPFRQTQWRAQDVVVVWVMVTHTHTQTNATNVDDTTRELSCTHLDMHRHQRMIDLTYLSSWLNLL